MNYDTSFNEQALFIMHSGSVSVNLIVVCILIKIKLRLVDFALVCIIGVRCIETFLVLHLIEINAPGFDLIDKKELSDSIPFIASPGMILAICNYKFDLLFTTPMTFLCTILSI